MRTSRVALVCFVGSFVSLLIGTADANPNSQKPLAPIKPHGAAEGDGGDALPADGWGTSDRVAAMYEAAGQIRQQVVKWHASDPRRVSASGLASTYRQLWLLREEAKGMRAVGETAAHDLSAQFESLNNRAYGLAQTVAATPAGQKFNQKALRRLERQLPARAELAEQAAAALQRGGKAEGVWKKMTSECAEVIGDTTFIFGKTRMKYWQPVVSPYTKAFQMLEADRVRAARGAMTAEGERLMTTAMSTFQTDVTRLVGMQVSAAPDVDPRIAALDDAVRTYATSLQKAAARADLAEVQAKFHFDAAALSATAKPLLQTVRTGKPGTDRAALVRLAAIERRHRGLTLVDAYLGRVDPAYEQAVTPVTKFLDRYHYRRTKAFAGDGFAATDGFMSRERTMPDGYAEPWNTARGVNRPLAQREVRDGVYRLVGENTAVAVGQPVLVEGVNRLAAGKRGGVRPIAGNHYVNVLLPDPDQVRRACAAAERMLLIDDEHPPGDAASARAIAGAEGWWFNAVGGEVVRVQAESLATRLATIKPLAAGLIPPNGLVRSGNAERSKFPQTLLWRVDVKPQWFMTAGGGSAMTE